MKQLTKGAIPGITLQANTPDEHIQAIHIYELSSQVVIHIKLGAHYKNMIDDVLQYLTPDDALALAQGLISCARTAASAATVPSSRAKASWLFPTAAAKQNENHHSKGESRDDS